MFSKVKKMSRRSHRFPWSMTLSVTQTCCLNLSLSKVDALTWSESHTFILSSFHLELGRTHTLPFCANRTRLHYHLMDFGNLDVPLFNMHLNISVKPRKRCHALEKSHHLRSGRRAEWRRPAPTTMARKRGVSWMFHVQEGDFHEVIFSKAYPDSVGKNNADNDCVQVQVPLIEILMQRCDLMKL